MFFCQSILNVWKFVTRVTRVINRKWLSVLALAFGSLSSFAQVFEIQGRVETGDTPVEMVFVHLERDTVQVGMVGLNRTGNFKFVNVAAGTYRIVIRQFGERDAVTNGVVVKRDTLIENAFPYPPPCMFSSERHPRCLNGHKDKIIPIVYGLPNEKLLTRAKKGKVRLAGCLVTSCDPRFWCTLHQIEL